MRVFKSSLIISFSLFFLTANAQNSDQFSGKIVDETNQSMPYVSLKIGSSISSMTNPDGDFSLRIPIGTTGQITVSCIGYQTLYIPIQQLSNPVTIKMKSAVSQLQEVKISALNGEAIIRKAMRNITQNYPVTAFESTGFYREVAKIDENYLSFAEASLQILNPGYQHNKEKDRIIINKERNLKRVGDRAVDNPFHAAVKGVPYVVLANDLLKNPGSIFGERYISKYNYTISGYTAVDGEEAYIIKFDQKTGINEALYQGSVIVIKKSFAIASIEISYSDKGRRFAKSDIAFLQRPLLMLLGYHFQKTNEMLSLRYTMNGDKWYPYFYKIATTHQVEAKRQKIAGELLVSAELFIRPVPAVKSDFSKKNIMPENYSFQQGVERYTDQYWKEFDYIKPEHTLKDLVDKQAAGKD
ncbi:carboxypeptidase-like regulatory domain-containing protein [Pedobacter antarcticus]|uniref:carboxypeptidase-like regulatory domain-containing protein n=1 Tax=Pedobacter antarcticus TaxID=34086 RepID=UPI00292F13D2|nr:carboxypeptidase-like regulatory domain-containing protein [Pedobacter antarcticus]